MGIVSYAQNFEDVLLNRVFASLHYAFYVDVGAYNPVEDSVTKSFYDRGWDGINIEPGEIFDQLADARPRDINLPIAVYDHTGTISFVQHPGFYAGLSHVQADTLASTEISVGEAAVEVRTVACDTLTNILAKYGGQRPIAFLKIDVEGAEEAIIRSTDWRAIRPTVILIEATKPRSTVLNNQHWEPILLDQGYQRAYFDGINCYYIPDERADLLRHFEMPVNVLDGFQRFDPRLETARAQAASVEAQLAALRAEFAQRTADRDQQREQNTALQRELQSGNDRLAAAHQTLESVTVAHTAAVAALTEANASQLADLRRQMADMEANCANMREECNAQLAGLRGECDAQLANLRRECDEQVAGLRRERDALLGVRDQAARLRRLMRELRWPDGPGALRAVLPLARLLRSLAGTKAPPVPPEEYALLTPEGTGPLLTGPVTAAAATEPLRRSIGKRAARLAYRPLRPIGRPAALRLRAFLTMQVHAEFMQLQEKLGQIRDEVARTPALPHISSVSLDDARLTELQTEIRQFGKLLENTLLTVAMESVEARHRAPPMPD